VLHYSTLELELENGLHD